MGLPTLCCNGKDFVTLMRENPFPDVYKRQGEDKTNDEIIRRYGYCGRKRVLELFEREELLKENMGAAAHLIHGSSDGRFTVTYAVKEISKEEIESVYFQAVDYDEAVRRYDVSRLKEGGIGWRTEKRSILSVIRRWAFGLQKKLDLE